MASSDGHAGLGPLCHEFADETREMLAEYHERGVPMKTLLSELEYIVDDERGDLK